MPRKAKETNEIIENDVLNVKNKQTNKKKTTKSQSTTNKKVASKKTNTTNTKKVASKKSTNKKVKTTTSRKKAQKVATKNTTLPETTVLEYYDLPYRYNQTMVKILAQTPTTLFVYWDISDEDKQKYIKEYGEYFFNDTKPVLIVHNSTMNYSYEVDINDFANSWYLHVPDANCDYTIELGRRPINKYSRINDYLFLSSSNDIVAPNDHILFDSFNNNVYFRNVKTNITKKKDISVSFLTKLGKIYNVKDFYKNLYKDKNIDFDRLNLKNMPSS